MNNKTNEYYTIDIVHIAKTLKQRIWVILLCGLLVGALGFTLAAFVIAPTYSSSVMLYVNNSLGNKDFSISASEITAAQSLVKTYREILINHTTLEMVIEKTGVSYTYQELYDMIEAESAGDTEIIKVTVTATDPYEAAKIANGIAEVLPIRVGKIIEGATMEVVDTAIPELEKVSPSITIYTAVGMALGLILSTLALIVVALSDGTVHDEDYVLNNYEHPVLAKIPDLMDEGDKHYGYYYRYGKDERGA